MAQEDIFQKPLRGDLQQNADKIRNAKKVNRIDEDSKTVEPPLTQAQVDALVKAYDDAILRIGESCQQLVLGIRITS